MEALVVEQVAFQDWIDLNRTRMTVLTTSLQTNLIICSRANLIQSINNQIEKAAME